MESCHLPLFIFLTGISKVGLFAPFYLGKVAVILMAAPSTALIAFVFLQNVCSCTWAADAACCKSWSPGNSLQRFSLRKSMYLSESGCRVIEGHEKEQGRGVKESEARSPAARFVPKMCPMVHRSFKCSEIIWKHALVLGCVNEITLINLPALWKFLALWFLEKDLFFFSHVCFYFSGLAVQGVPFSTYWEDVFKGAHLHSSEF